MSYTSRTNTFPSQKVSSREKNKEWRESSLDSVIGRVYTHESERDRMVISYNILNSEFDLNDFKYVTDPYKVDEGFPAKMQNVNIIKPKIELLKGEESKRPDTL